MKLKNIFNENVARRYSNIKNIKEENISLNINPMDKLKKDWIILLAIIVIIVGILLIDFNAKYFIASIAILLGLLVLFIFGNKTYLKCNKDYLVIKQGFQNAKIPYSNLKNIYIGKVTGLSYNIIIRYKDNFSLFRELEYSLLCANPEDVNNFINNFEIEDKTEEIYFKLEKRKFWKKLIFLAFWAIIFIVLCIYFIKQSGINFF